jgi:hypothetical protein
VSGTMLRGERGAGWSGFSSNFSISDSRASLATFSDFASDVADCDGWVLASAECDGGGGGGWAFGGILFDRLRDQNEPALDFLLDSLRSIASCLSLS